MGRAGRAATSARTGERQRRIRSFGVSICASLLLGLTPGNAYECLSEAEIAVFPLPGEIPSNAVFVLQGVGKETATIRGLASADIALHSAGVDRRVRILSRSNGYLSHVVLAPAEGGLTEGPIELRIRHLLPGREPVWTPVGKWIVSSAPDRTLPDLNASDSAASLTRTETWVESIHVDFSVGASESPVLLLASIEESKDEIPTGTREELFLFPGKHYLYRGLCGRNHALERGKQYLVDLVAVDAAGNRSRSTGEVFVIDVP